MILLHADVTSPTIAGTAETLYANNVNSSVIQSSRFCRIETFSPKARIIFIVSLLRTLWRRTNFTARRKLWTYPTIGVICSLSHLRLRFLPYTVLQ